MPVLGWDGVADAPTPFDVAPRGTDFKPVTEIPRGQTPVPQSDPARQSAAPKVWLTDILFAIGFGGYGAAALSGRTRRDRRVRQTRKPLKMNPPPVHD